MHYVIGDIHGSFDDLQALLSKIEDQDQEAQFIFVGDWPDRGPKVCETLLWMADNITPEGKYQSVRGNHDQEALQWYYMNFLPWLAHTSAPLDQDPPSTVYDLADVVARDFQMDLDKLQPVIDTIEKMPFSKVVRVNTAGGKKLTYRIMHAWHPVSLRDRLTLPKERIAYININERNYGDLPDNFKEIYVHGHTPTILLDYLAKGRDYYDRPGLISYRQNVIDVDGGCCFFPYRGFACMLCAVCLETLEEIYPYPLEGRIRKALELNLQEKFQGAQENSAEILDHACRVQMTRYYNHKESCAARTGLLKRAGLA